MSIFQVLFRSWKGGGDIGENYIIMFLLYLAAVFCALVLFIFFIRKTISKERIRLQGKVEISHGERKLKDYPGILVTQKFANISQSKLNISWAKIVLKGDGREIHKFDRGEIVASDILPHKQDCWIKCKTTKLNQAVSEFTVNGSIVFVTEGIISTKNKVEIEGKTKLPTYKPSLIVV